MNPFKDWSEQRSSGSSAPAQGGPRRMDTYKVPFREEWAFTETGPDTMETPGAVWHRDPLP